jgi:molybdopterin converting factor small subunit
MAVVALRSPLRELAGGNGHLEVEGATLGEVIGRLEADYPKLTGWVLDERGQVRPHVNLFVNGERASLDHPLSPEDRVHVLPSITGGAMTMTQTREQVAAVESDQGELLVGTRKGLFVLRGPRGGSMSVAARRFSGQVVEFAVRDRRTGRYFAAVTHGQYGPRLYFSEDPVAETWDQAKGPAFPEGTDTALVRIWVIQPGEEPGVLWAGTDPGALFKSVDDGASWSLNRSLWKEPSRPSWEPGAGGLCLHSIATWPGDASRLAVGISAAGVWLSDDGGETWRRGNKGLVARYLPDEAREGASDLCVHNIHRAPLDPETIYMQFHGGVYRSDDGGESWNDIGTDRGLPSDFGFPLVADPNDPGRAFVIPLSGDFDRVTPEGRVRVFETRDRGETWMPLDDGLPQESAFLTILRQAFGHDGREPLGLYFGAESGDVFGSANGGATWAVVAAHLPPVLSVRCSA